MCNPSTTETDKVRGQLFPQQGIIERSLYGKHKLQGEARLPPGQACVDHENGIIHVGEDLFTTVKYMKDEVIFDVKVTANP
jgi:hypothetical protein